MKADLVKRIVRAIAEGSQGDLDRLAQKVVESERKTGHRHLADEPRRFLVMPSAAQVSRVTAIRIRQAGCEHSRRVAVTANSSPRSFPGKSSSTTWSFRRRPKSGSRADRTREFYEARERLGAYGLSPRKTILLHGPPGCGKSLGAKRLAWKTGLPLLKVRFDALISSFFGESALNLRSIFVAAKDQPSVLLLDECDFIARSRVGRQRRRGSRHASLTRYFSLWRSTTLPDCSWLRPTSNPPLTRPCFDASTTYSSFRYRARKRSSACCA